MDGQKYLIENEDLPVWVMIGQAWVASWALPPASETTGVSTGITHTISTVVGTCMISAALLSESKDNSITRVSLSKMSSSELHSVEVLSLPLAAQAAARLPNQGRVGILENGSGS